MRKKLLLATLGYVAVGIASVEAWRYTDWANPQGDPRNYALGITIWPVGWLLIAAEKYADLSDRDE